MTLLAAGLVPFLVYLRFLCPSPPIGDSTEFALVFHYWGIPHATGYPLYVLLGGLWDRLPLGSVAYRANLFSAVLAGAACAVVAWAYLRLLGRRLAAVLAAYVTAFSSVFWSQAIIAEVYALHCLLVGVVLVAFAHWQQARSDRSLVWLALAAGLAFSHHRTAVFVSAPFMLAALILHRPLRLSVLAKAVAAGLAPFAVYAYLPIRAQADPIVIWGDCKTWSGFREYMTATAFRHFIFSRHGPELLGFYHGALNDLSHAMTWVGVVLAAGGWAWLWWRNRAFALCSNIAFVLTAAWAGGYGAVDAPVFMIANYIFVGLWVGAGAHGAALAVAALGRAAKSRRAAIARWVVPAALALLPWHMLTANLSAHPAALWGEGLWYTKHLLRVDLSDYWDIYDIGQVLVAEPSRGALVVLQGHGAYTIALYLQLVEGRRPDLTFVSRELAHHAYYRRRQPPDLRRIMDEARAVFDTGIAGAEGDWGRIMLTVTASRIAASRPLFTNADTSLLPPGFQVLWGAIAHRIVPGHAQRYVTRRIASRAEPKPLGFGVSVFEAAPLRDPATLGRVLPIRLKWLCSTPIEFPLQTRVWLPTERAVADWAAAQRDPALGQPASLDEFRSRSFTVARPFAYGIVPLGASAPGTCYQQTVYLVVPRSRPRGRHAVLLSLETEEEASAPVQVGTVAVRR